MSLVANDLRGHLCQQNEGSGWMKVRKDDEVA